MQAKPLPRYAPMLAQAGSLPEEDGRYAYEVKYDGWRVLAYLDRGAVKLCSRNGVDLTPRCPELALLGRALRRRRLVLDGELVVLGESGRPGFDALQERMRAGLGPPFVTLMLFDLLHLDA